MNKKEKLSVVGLLLCAMLSALCLLADTVAPASVTFTNCRADVVNGAVSQTTFVEGTTLIMTNCVIYSGGTTSSAVQGLDGVAIEIRIGDLFSSTAYTGTVISAVGGTWWTSITVPTNYSSTFLQMKLTDASTNSFIYPLRIIRTVQPLQ
jgi:hypothetical protein